MIWKYGSHSFANRFWQSLCLSNARQQVPRNLDITVFEAFKHLSAILQCNSRFCSSFLRTGSANYINKTPFRLYRKFEKPGRIYLRTIATINSSTENSLEAQIQSSYVVLQKLSDSDTFLELLGSKHTLAKKKVVFNTLRAATQLEDLDLINKFSITIKNSVLLVGNGLTTEDKLEISRCLDRILYFYVLKVCIKEANELFTFMKEHSLVSARTYDLMVRIYCKADTDFSNSARTLIDEMKQFGFEPSARTYFPLLIGYIDVGDHDNAFKMFEFIKQIEKNINEESHGLLLSTLAQNRHHVLSDTLFQQVLQYHKERGYLYGWSSRNALRSVFERIDQGKWKVAVSQVSKGGTCLSCGAQLQNMTITANDIVSMNRGLASFLKFSLAADIPVTDFNDYQSLAKYYRDIGEIVKDRKELNSKVKNLRISTMRNLKLYLQQTGPFDVIVDMLNLGYSGQKGFNAAKVEVVIRELIEDGKKVIGLCAGPLRDYLLHKGATLQRDEVRTHRMIQRLKKWGCGLFFVGSSKIDDLYILFTILHHNFNAQVLTEDQFVDHLEGMDKFAVTAFKKWMKINTIQLLRFDDGRPIFKVGTSLDYVVQIQENMYHFPMKNGHWLCCSRAMTNEADAKAIDALKGLK